MDNELLYLLALSRISGVGNILIKQLISYSGSASAVYAASKSNLAKIPGIGSLNAAAIMAGKQSALLESEAELNRVEKSGARLLHYLQAAYPARLKKIPDAPPVLYLKGCFRFEAPRILAVVGTRQASNYGKEAIEHFLEELRVYQPVIVSGLAYGIDAHAHKVALQLGLETWAVLGTSVRQIYPSVHKSLAEKIMENGGIISETALDAKPEPTRFPERNRIIAGLSDAIWVVEAMEKGGALITARLGLDYFRDVFALPGNYHQAASAGCNALIASGSAGLVGSGRELAQSAGWKLPEKHVDQQDSEQTEGDFRPESVADPEEWQVLKMLSEGEGHLDELSWRSGIGVNRLAGILLNLEFAGLVRSLPGKKYQLKRH